MYTKEQAKQILPILWNMRICIIKNVTYIPVSESVNDRNFNLHDRFGICWHVFSGTYDQDIGMDFLSTAFVDLGYQSEYPVESKMFDTIEEIEKYFKTSDYIYKNLYEKGTAYGDIRNALLNDLIQYFENVIENHNNKVFNYVMNTYGIEL